MSTARGEKVKAIEAILATPGITREEAVERVKAELMMVERDACAQMGKHVWRESPRFGQPCWCGATRWKGQNA